MTDAERKRIDQLQESGLGYRRIAATVGLSDNTVKSYLRRKATSIPTEHLCHNCGRSVPQTPHKKAKLYCSDQCRMTWWKAHPSQMRRKAFYQITCLHCGKVFEVYGNPNRKYCCRGCYLSAREKEGDNRE